MLNFLRNTYAVLRRELTRLAHQPMYFVLMLVLPVVSFAFFALLFNKGVARDIPIAVLDQDHTSLSRKVTQMIDDTATAMVSYGIQDMDEGERLMREGKIMAIVQIPAFFEKNILSNSQTHIETYISGTNITVNGLLSKDIQTAVTTFSGGIQIQLLTKQGLTELQAMAQLMPVRFNKHVLFNPYINYGYYLSPSFMPMMLLIFIVMVTVFTIGTELKKGTAREWIETGNGSVSAALLGKVLPVTVVMFLMSLVMFLIIFKVVGVPLNGSHPAEHAALRDELSGHRGLHRLAAVEPAPFALDRRRLFGAGLHLFGTHVPDHGHVARHAVPEQALPVHLLHRHLRRSDAAGRPGRLLAARHVLHVAVHCLTASVPAAPADHLHGGKILGEVIA